MMSVKRQDLLNELTVSTMSKFFTWIFSTQLQEHLLVDIFTMCCCCCCARYVLHVTNDIGLSVGSWVQTLHHLLVWCCCAVWPDDVALSTSLSVLLRCSRTAEMYFRSDHANAEKVFNFLARRPLQYSYYIPVHGLKVWTTCIWWLLS